MKKLCFLFVLLIFGNVNHSLAQYAMPQYSSPPPPSNQDFQTYQQKLQKFIATLNPQERMILLYSITKSSSSDSSKECELDWSTKNKIDEIADKVDDIERKLRRGSYYVNCNSY